MKLDDSTEVLTTYIIDYFINEEGDAEIIKEEITVSTETTQDLQ